MDKTVRAASPRGAAPTLNAMVTAFRKDQPGETALEALVRHVLAAMLEQRATRQPE
jgi:hypothetical protein